MRRPAVTLIAALIAASCAAPVQTVTHQTAAAPADTYTCLLRELARMG